MDFCISGVWWQEQTERDRLGRRERSGKNNVLYIVTTYKASSLKKLDSSCLFISS
jgi:hypothetical protein